jgi:RNA polymerase sigma-70 factor (ECF subfamily)
LSFTETEAHVASLSPVWTGRQAPRARIKRPKRMPPALRTRSPRTAVGSASGLRRRSDRELLALACEGNPDAFELIYDRHSTIAYSLARRICGARGLAEDVVQEAFLSLWRGRDRYDARRGEVRSWLLQIVHNSAIDRLRRSDVHDRRRASAEGIEEQLEAPERTDEEVQSRERATEVRNVLAALPAEQRRVIELAYFQGLTHTQIAAKLEQPVGTIKGRMRLALAKLHGQLTSAEGPTAEEEATR